VRRGVHQGFIAALFFIFLCLIISFCIAAGTLVRFPVLPVPPPRGAAKDVPVIATSRTAAAIIFVAICHSFCFQPQSENVVDGAAVPHISEL
jgi:hypothetical protein